MLATVLNVVVLTLSAPPVEISETPRTQLYVRTFPCGAMVQVDGKMLGKSDALFVLAPGTRTITVSLDGRETIIRQVNVAPGEVTRLELQLAEQATAVLTAGERAIVEGLVSPAELHFIEVPLTDCIEHLSRRRNTPIQFDQASLNQAGIDLQTPIVCNIKDISFRAALRLVLEPRQLTPVIRFDTPLITTRAEAARLVKAGAIDPAALPSGSSTANAKGLPKV